MPVQLQKNRRNLNILAACMVAFALVTFIGYILVDNYLNRIQLHQNALGEHKVGTDKIATQLNYFFNEREYDLDYIANSRAVKSYFENKALGMSMEYGLKAALLSIEDKFKSIIEQKEINNIPIYDRLWCLDKDENVLVDSGNILMGASDRPVGLEEIDAASRDFKIIPASDNGNYYLYVACPLIFKEQYAGHVVAVINEESLRCQIGDDGDNEKRHIFITYNEKAIFTHCDARLCEFIEDEISFKPGHSFEFKNNDNIPYIAVSVPVENTPFSICSVVDARGIVTGAGPLQILLGMIALAVVVLGGGLLFFRSTANNLILKARFDEKQLQQEKLEKVNTLLVEEISCRKNNETLLTATIESTADGILVLNKHGQVTNWNSRFISMWHLDEDVLNNGEHDKFLKSILENVKDGDDFALEISESNCNMESFSGILNTVEDHYFERYSQPMICDNDIIGRVWCFRDVTLKMLAEKSIIQAKEDAENANKIKTQFLANMSHEIRTPMNSILGFTDLLAQESLNDQQHDYISTIRSSGHSLLNIINDILDFSKIEAGNMNVELIECSLEEILNDVGSMLQPLAKEKELDFKILHRTVLPEIIRTDPSRLNQCLTNLVGNAIKFTDSGHVHIQVSCNEHEPDPYIRFDVEDTGIGISQNKLGTIFNSFSQADGSTTRIFGGTGLGLTITKQLAELLDGSVSVKSKLDCGSVFTLMVPVGIDIRNQHHLGEASLKEYTSNYDSSNQTLYSGNVLVAEDAEPNQKLIQILLQKKGLEPVIKENGKLAVEAAIDNDFDLIFMDMQMPVMNGYDATQELRNKSISTPVIALTANAMKGDKEKCLNAGCDEYLSKPIDQAKLYAVLDKYLSSNVELVENNEQSITTVKDESTAVSSIDENIIDWKTLTDIFDEQEDVIAIVEAFSSDTPIVLEKLITAFRENDYENLALYAHRIKSSAAILGAESASICAAELERIGKSESENLDAAKDLIDDMKKHIEDITILLHKGNWIEKIKK